MIDPIQSITDTAQFLGYNPPEDWVVGYGCYLENTMRPDHWSPLEWIRWNFPPAPTLEHSLKEDITASLNALLDDDDC